MCGSAGGKARTDEMLTIRPQRRSHACAKKACDILEKVSGEVLYDDREERPGVKFKDADLVGCPIQIILGGKGVARGVAETRNRLDGARGEIAITDLEAGLASFVDSVLAMWKNRRP